MLGKIFGVLCLISLLFGIFSGNATRLGSALLDGTERAVQISLSLCGMMCLWGGVMRVFSEAGVIRVLSRLLSPFLRLFFPDAARTGEGLEEICANISANLLGMGNAATPFAVSAMEKLQRHNPCPTVASSEQITLAVLNTAPLTLIPANLLALRRSAGSERPFAILVPVWICSAVCSALALLLCRLASQCDRRKQSVNPGERRQPK